MKKAAGLASTLFAISFLLSAPSLKAQEKNFILRTMDWGYKIVQGDSVKPRKKYYLAIPIVAYKPESRWILGISMAHIFRRAENDSQTRPSIIRVNVSYSQERQFSVRPMVEYFSKKNRLNIRAQYTYTNFAEYYWGIGPTTPKENKELYHFRMNRANVKAAYLVMPRLYAGLQYAYEHMYQVRYSNANGLLESSQVKGYDGYVASGPGFTLYYDDRDNVYFPFSGHMIELSNVFYNKAFGGGNNFVNVTLDARKYKQLWKENILAFQAFVNLNSGDIPFRLRGTLGSDIFMRGYYNGRFRDNHAAAFQAELRKTIWGPVGCVVFAGFGSVSNKVNGLADHIKPNIGAGLRVKAIPRERVNIRMDYGFGSDGNKALYLTLNEAF